MLRPLEPGAVGEMARGELDLAVMPQVALANVPPGVDTEALVHRAVFEERFVCVVRRGHRLAGRRVDAAQFARLPHVLVTPQGSGLGVVDALLAAEAGGALARRVAYRVPAFLMALPIVAASDCVATVPERLVAHAGPPLAQLDPPWTIPGFTVLMGWHPNRGEDGAHRWVRERLRAALGGLEPATDGARAERAPASRQKSRTRGR